MISKRNLVTAFLYCILTSGILALFLGVYSRNPLNVSQRNVGPETLATQSLLKPPAKNEPPTNEDVPEYKVVAPGENLHVPDVQVHIATAVHYRHTPNPHGFDLFLNGWARHNDSTDFVCCLLEKLPTASNRDITYVQVQAKLYNLVKTWIVDMQNAEFTCHIPNLQDLKSGTSDFKYVTFAKESCDQAPLEAMEILHPTPVPNSIGLCLKVTYGKLKPTKMVEWFEYTRLMGVTKVFTYYFDVEPDVLKVLEYYKKIGYLDLLLIHPAKSKYGKDRGFRHPRWSEQAFVDEVMGANDCKHRMAGFDYVIVMDIDEFIVPKGNLTSYFDVLQRAERKNPKVSCFRFDSHIAMPDWGATRQVPLYIMQFTQRTAEPNYDGVSRNVRWGFRPNATHFVLNNYCTPIKSHKQMVLPESLYTFLHYRGCKKQWKGCFNRTRVDDRTLTKYEVSLADRILNLPANEVLPGEKTYINALQKWRDQIS